MNCNSIESLFSDLFDGQLAPARRAKVESHLQTCAACRENYAAFERTTSALRDSAAPQTEPSLAADILAAVDQAASAEASRSETDFRRAMTLVQGDTAQQGRRRRAASLAAAMLGSAAAAVVTLQLAFGTLSSRTVEVVRSERVEVPVEVVREVVREVKVEVPVEVIRTVKVPVEVIREVKVPVEVIREVEVPRGPLFEVNGQRLAAALNQFGEDLVSASQTVAETIAANPSQRIAAQGRRPEQSRIAAQTPPITLFDEYNASATFDVRKQAGRIQSRSSGTLTDLIPLLLTGLDSGDDSVADAANERLEMIHNQLNEDPRLASVLVDRQAGQGWQSADSLLAMNGHRQWRAWWESNRQVIADQQL
jgi:hypothetical protein